MIKPNFTLIVFSILFLIQGCKSDNSDTPEVFKFKENQTSDYIAVYGTDVEKSAFVRAYNDIKFVMDKMDTDIKQGLIKSAPKMLVVKNENELESNIDFFTSFLPVESVFTNEGGIDETKTSSTDVGLSNTKLELMYLCVYYSMLTSNNLESKYNELKTAYYQAIKKGIFIPGEAYVDGYNDEIHQNASDKNALKYGSYLNNLYRLYFGNDKGAIGEFKITTKRQLQNQNELGYNFVKKYFDL